MPRLPSFENLKQKGSQRAQPRTERQNTGACKGKSSVRFSEGPCLARRGEPQGGPPDLEAERPCPSPQAPEKAHRPQNRRNSLDRAKPGLVPRVLLPKTRERPPCKNPRDSRLLHQGMSLSECRVLVSGFRRGAGDSVALPRSRKAGWDCLRQRSRVQSDDASRRRRKPLYSTRKTLAERKLLRKAQRRTPLLRSLRQGS
jgi:hypothetical protein